jgi:GntR family histidine utilization transcriptional repressor
VSSATIPRYRQLKELIIRQIFSGELRPRDRVPSENELVESTGVSRMTANRALRELNDEGYVERVAGVGTFVADLKAASHVLEVRNIADEIALRGHEHKATILRCAESPADNAAAEALQIDVGMSLLHARLVHHESDIPIQLEERFVLPRFAPQFLHQDFTAITPSAYLSSVSPLQEAEHIVRAEMPDQETRENLQMDSGEPCLVVNRRTWSHGSPVTYARLFHPASRFELSGHYAPPGAEAANRRVGGGSNSK